MSDYEWLDAQSWAYSLRSRWETFAYNYGWSEYIFLLDGWIAKCAMAVPIVGYLILFNDSVSQHLSFNQLASEEAKAFGLSASARLKFIYFGLIFLGSANIVYVSDVPLFSESERTNLSMSRGRWNTLLFQTT